MVNLGDHEIENFISEIELEKIVKIMSKLPTGWKYKDTVGTSIGIGHPLRNWFDKLVFKKVQKIFGDKCKMLFSMYLDEDDPFKIHSDYFHKRIGEPFITFLIPLSVDNNKNKVHLAKTIVFDQFDTFVDNDIHTKKSYTHDFKKIYNKPLDNNASYLHETELAHLDKNDLKLLSVKKVLPWTRGNAIYWEAKSLHCSNDYKQKGMTSKQAIVIHTYKEEE